MGKLSRRGMSRCVSALNFALARYNTDGSLDPTFGSKGTVITNLGSNSGTAAVAIQPDGKVVAAGYTTSEDTGYDFALVRYNSDGMLDSHFGSGGKVITDLVGGNDWAMAITIQPDGKIVAAGNTSGGDNHPDDLALVRYNPDGSLDSDFGEGGKVLIGMNRHGDARAVAVQSSGKILTAGTGNSNLKMFDFALLRFDKNGSLDPAFGSRGIVLTSLGNSDAGMAMALQSDGKVVVAGQTVIISGYTNFALVRYDIDGSLDPTFGVGGAVINNPSGDYAARGIAIQSDSKIVATGIAIRGDNTASFVLARYNADGSLDSSFGASGKVITAIGRSDYASAAAIQVDGKIVVAGSAEDVENAPRGITNRPRRFALVRYLP